MVRSLRIEYMYIQKILKIMQLNGNIRNKIEIYRQRNVNVFKHNNNIIIIVI